MIVLKITTCTISTENERNLQLAEQFEDQDLGGIFVEKI